MKPVVTRASLLCATLVATASPTAHAVLPLPAYPDCAKNYSLEACPPDITHADGSWGGDTWEYVSFISPDMKSTVRAEEQVLGSGNGADVAWRYSTGRFDVTVAVIDSGILWGESELSNKILLNKNELPLPQTSGGSTCAAYDCNGDGLFNLQDYKNDPRARIDGGVDTADDRLDPSDLIAAFSNGRDEDSNGFIDDIAGWDFLWDDNQAYASNGFDHGTGVMESIGAEGGEAGSSIGYCPNCSILPLRGGDSFMADANRLAQGIMYATDRGVKVIAMASGTVNNPAGLHDALEYAYAHGVLVVVAIGDELSYHHLYPGASDYAMAVHSIRYWPMNDWDTAQTFLSYNGCNNFGTHLTLVAGTTACATGSTAITAAAAGLVYSRGRDLGLELHPDEVRAMLINEATDIDVAGSGEGKSPYFPSRAGWDLFFGYGRINIGRTLEQWAIPPQVHLTGPAWYDYIDAASSQSIPISAHLAAPRAASYDWVLEWAPGGDAKETDFEPLAYGSETAARDGVIFDWPVASIPRDKLDPAQPLEQITADEDVLTKFGKVNVHTITLRLRVSDNVGRGAEMRKAFFLHDDADLLPGFPIDMGASGQSTPFLADLDQDGVQEILLGTSSGLVHAFTGGTTAELPGWPIQMPYTRSADPANPAGHYSQPAYASGGVDRLHEGVLSTLNAGDLDGDGALEVVVSTMDGLTYVYSAGGQLRPGFPVSREAVSDADTNALDWFDPGFISSPMLADLDNDGKLEIIQGGMDQKLYVWRENGDTQPGWPVKLEYSGSEQHIKGRIVSSPAIADLNLDGVPDIVIGTNEYDPTLYFPGYAYAVSGRGGLEPGGAVLPGWPVSVMGCINGLVPFVGEGVPDSPVIDDVDGDGYPEIAMSGVVGCPHLYKHNGQRSVQYACGEDGWNDPATTEHLGLTYVTNSIFGDMDGDGHQEIVASLSGMGYLAVLASSTWKSHQDHMVALWDARTGQTLPGWPVVLEDLPAFVRPAMGDVDGDGAPEVIASSGGYVTHAYDINGVDAPGWPKLTGGFATSGITVGDVTGDGRNEVIMATQEGYLFAWTTAGVASVISPISHERSVRPSRGLRHPAAFGGQRPRAPGR